MIAASNGHAVVVELLLSKGANVEAANTVMIPIVFTGFVGAFICLKIMQMGCETKSPSDGRTDE